MLRAAGGLTGRMELSTRGVKERWSNTPIRSNVEQYVAHKENASLTGRRDVHVLGADSAYTGALVSLTIARQSLVTHRLSRGYAESLLSAHYGMSQDTLALGPTKFAIGKEAFRAGSWDRQAGTRSRKSRRCMRTMHRLGITELVGSRRHQGPRTSRRGTEKSLCLEFGASEGSECA